MNYGYTKREKRMDKLGIETQLIIAQVVNFAIIIFFLNKLLYKPILGMLEKRKKKIQEGLDLTEKMQEEAEKMEIKKGKVIADAKKEAIAIIEEAKTQGKTEEKQIIEAAHREADDIIEKGKGQAAEQKLQMMKEIRGEAVQLATVMAGRLLSSIMTQEAQRSVLKKHIRELDEIA